jgi:hypothetical protein
MKKVTVWDPGTTSGLVQAIIRDDERVEIIGKFEIPGGLEGVSELIWNGWDIFGVQEEVWVSERFRMTPRVRTAAQVEPLRIEGVIAHVAPHVIWQYPDAMLLAGGYHGSASRNKTAADGVLRSMGLWTLPSEVDNHTDANDINSAMKHLVAYLRNSEHQPTIDAIHAATVQADRSE